MDTKIAAIMLVVACLSAVFIFSMPAGSQVAIVNVTYNLSCPQANFTLSCPESQNTCDSGSYAYDPLFIREFEISRDRLNYGCGGMLCGDIAIELFKRLKSDGYEDVRILNVRYKEPYCQEDVFDCRHYLVAIGEGYTLFLDPLSGNIYDPLDARKTFDILHSWDEVTEQLEDDIDDSRKMACGT